MKLLLLLLVVKEGMIVGVNCGREVMGLGGDGGGLLSSRQHHHLDHLFVHVLLLLLLLVESVALVSRTPLLLYNSYYLVNERGEAKLDCYTTAEQFGE